MESQGTIRNEHMIGASVQDNYRKTQVVLQCDGDERGAHSEKNARCGHTSETKGGVATPKVERCV